MGSKPFHTMCKILAGLSVAAGSFGMLMSFLHLGSKNMDYIVAGASGFVAGAILIGSGMISLSLLASSEVGDTKRFTDDSTDEGIMKRR